MPKASFVIPSFNSAAWLPHAIESCQKQSYGDIEIVVVDDGSTDSTRQLMEFLSKNDARIKYLRLDKNLGRSAARNTGNMAAAGEFIFVLDADDIAYPNRVKDSLAKLKHCDFVHGSMEIMDVIGSKLGTHLADVFNKEKSIMEKINRIMHSSCAYRKDLAMRIPYRSGDLSRLGLDDWAFELDVAFSDARMDHIISVIGAYRDLDTGVTKTRSEEDVEKEKNKFLDGLKVTA